MSHSNEVDEKFAQMMLPEQILTIEITNIPPMIIKLKLEMIYFCSLETLL